MNATATHPGELRARVQAVADRVGSLLDELEPMMDELSALERAVCQATSSAIADPHDNDEVDAALNDHGADLVNAVIARIDALYP